MGVGIVHHLKEGMVAFNLYISKMQILKKGRYWWCRTFLAKSFFMMNGSQREKKV
jgi:hypothetical protein